MKCKVCGVELESWSLITGIAKPCGHRQFDDKTARKNARMMRELNRDISKIVRGR
jgi:hypothetical protein